VRYSIITPTMVRPTLRRTCESINAQTNGDWEHIIMVDVPLIIHPEKRAFLSRLGNDPRRKIFRCGKAHRDYGNTCRYNAGAKASGDYVLYLDDDDYYADNRVFETLNQVTAPWAIFPTMRWGAHYSVDPPGWNRSGSGMFMHKRVIARYPCFEHHDEHKAFIEKVRPLYPNMQYKDRLYAADGLLAEWLKDHYPYQSLNHERPLTIYEQKGAGKE
jgi:glycosyltransferase involved in cell wall biosynthesis